VAWSDSQLVLAHPLECGPERWFDLPLSADNAVTGTRPRRSRFVEWEGRIIHALLGGQIHRSRVVPCSTRVHYVVN